MTEELPFERNAIEKKGREKNNLLRYNKKCYIRKHAYNNNGNIIPVTYYHLYNYKWC